MSEFIFAGAKNSAPQRSLALPLRRNPLYASAVGRRNLRQGSCNTHMPSTVAILGPTTKGAHRIMFNGKQIGVK